VRAEFAQRTVVMIAVREPRLRSESVIPAPIMTARAAHNRHDEDGAARSHDPSATALA
jgi:hypothetical protein